MRTHYCGQVDESLLGEEVVVCGWVHTHRDHGGVIFTNLRDHRGIVQVVVEPDNEPAFNTAYGVRFEYCLRIRGQVRYRPEGQRNDRMPTGQIEIVADEVEVLSTSVPLPFQLDEETSEETRLRYRYVDLRRPSMQEALRLRARITSTLRRYLEARDFLELETPILTKATPEGARDYLVPSRIHPGSFYALPQSPQLFKQLLMMSGMDRYYQFARCFRDEDLRADRQPEFTQLDMEMAFVREDDVMDVVEAMIRDLFERVLETALPEPFPRMPYTEAMRRFGSDRPDLRNPLELVDVAEHVSGSDFKVFAGPANDPAGRVAALRVPGGGQLTRKQIDDYQPYVERYGAKGLAWIKVNDRNNGREGLQSPIVKFLGEGELEAILAATGAGTGDLVFFGAGDATTVTHFMGALRLKVGEDLGLTKRGWQPLWVTDFPMFERDPDNGRWTPLHHPFTGAKTEDPTEIEGDPGNLVSRAYDLVLNGTELGGGSIRIHRSDVQQAVFRVLEIDEATAREQFGFLLDALQFGAPPHGGIALGLDRIAMLMAGVSSLRDVIPFPKTTTASCLLTHAPAAATEEQLRELHVKVVAQEKSG